jgi:hypothetical protein
MNQMLDPLAATPFNIVVAAASFADDLEEALRFLSSDEIPIVNIAVNSGSR